MWKSAFTAAAEAAGTVPKQHEGYEPFMLHMVTRMSLSVTFVMFSSQASFIPTMPDDVLTVAQQAMKDVQWYCE